MIFSRVGPADPLFKGWAWVPEFVTIDEENFSYYDVQLVGDGLSYLSYDYDEAAEKATQSMCRYSLADGTVTKTPLSYEAEGNWNLNRVIYEIGRAHV